MATGLKEDQAYFFRVAAYNDAGQSDWTYGVLETQPPIPAAPSALVFSNYSATKKTVLMTWKDNSTNESGFVTEYSTDGTTWLRGATLGANVNGRTATNVTSDKTYYFRVAAYNDVGQSAWTTNSYRVPSSSNAILDDAFAEYFDDELVEMI